MSETSDFKVSPAYALWLACNSWRRLAREYLDPLDITYSQLVILSAVYKLGDENGPTQSDIAHYTAMDENMISQLVKHLEQQAWVQRECSCHDRRSKTVRLTESGQMKLFEAKKAMEPALVRFTSPIEEELPELMTILSKLIAHDPIASQFLKFSGEK